MNSAQYFESNLPSTSRSLFLPDLAGLDMGRYEHRKLYSSTVFWRTCCRCPAPSPGILATAEAIYDGPQDNLIGIETFSGSQDNKSPQHAGSAWHVGSGEIGHGLRPAFATEGYFGYTVIIEKGCPMASIRDGRGRRAAHHHSSRRRPDHQLSRHKGTALNAGPFVGGNRAGGADDWHFESRGQTDAPAGADRQILNLLLRGFVSGLAEEAATTSCSTSPGTLWRCRIFAPKKCRPVATTSKLFADFRDWEEPTGRSGGISAPIRGTAVLKFLKDPRTSKEVRNLAFAHFTPDEFPTHRMLQELRDARRWAANATRSWKSRR